MIVAKTYYPTNTTILHASGTGIDDEEHMMISEVAKKKSVMRINETVEKWTLNG